MILYTGGTFDLFHDGHVNFLRHCKKLASDVVVSLNTDEFIERYKGTAPVLRYEQRKDILLSCRYVDDVVKNEYDEDSKPTILKVSPNVIAIGDDWARKDYYKQMSFTQQWLDNNDITLVYIPYKQGISTTEIKKALKTV